MGHPKPKKRFRWLKIRSMMPSLPTLSRILCPQRLISLKKEQRLKCQPWWYPVRRRRTERLVVLRRSESDRCCSECVGIYSNCFCSCKLLSAPLGQVLDGEYSVVCWHGE